MFLVGSLIEIARLGNQEWRLLDTQCPRSSLFALRKSLSNSELLVLLFFVPWTFACWLWCVLQFHWLLYSLGGHTVLMVISARQYEYCCLRFAKRPLGLMMKRLLNVDLAPTQSLAIVLLCTFNTLRYLPLLLDLSSSSQANRGIT